jgi:hypothetical protein
MKVLRPVGGLCLAGLVLVVASPALALANRVFVSARLGNDANSCDNALTPCQTFAGAVTQLNPNGEVIVLDSGGYGPVTITQGVTIEAPAGVTAFIHPPSGDAITVNASGATVTLRGLVLNGGTQSGISVPAVGTLNVENCFITGFGFEGIYMFSPGQLNVKGTDIKNCANNGIIVNNSTGVATTWIDHCHLDGNGSNGFQADTTSPGSSKTMATYSTTNGNFTGWICGNGGSTGRDLLSLEFCTGSGNGADGLFSDSGNVLSRARYSNCVFADNGAVGVGQAGAGVVESRGNNTFMGNTSGSTNGTVGSFSAQ